jgi:transcriptional regulator GlxA family with amidase domain
MAGAPADRAALSRLGFLTLPNYSMIACANALEACRMANYVAGETLYAWRIVTLDGAPARASNGLDLQPTSALAAAGELDVLFVCGGVNIRHAVSRKLKDTLRRVARDGVALGALCTGSFILAEAGLLAGHRCAIHWENLAGIREEFPDIDFVEDIFSIDGDRLTCTGGVAPLDMMLTLIEARLGHDLTQRISEQFIVERVRAGTDNQHALTSGRIGGVDPVVTLAARAMENALGAPLKVDEIARAAGVTARQLERLFKRHLGTEPGQFYLSLRLDRARQMLRQTGLSVTEIGVACGFQSMSHFTATYSRRFGHTPRAERAA